jgi:enamine deaminase RidA (YjgF/YER057c/UK114 family)
VFEYITKILHEAGADWKDVVKLNTYYDFSGSGDVLRKYRERMTKVRLEFLPNPGPAGTALRVGLGYPGLLIEVDAIAVIDGTGTKRTRIMPRHHWDWPVPVPLSQGWRAGNLVFVGGQVSQDEQGSVIGPGEIEVQTRTTFQNIGRVLRDAGADWKDVVELNRREELGTIKSRVSRWEVGACQARCRSIERQQTKASGSMEELRRCTAFRWLGTRRTCAVPMSRSSAFRGRRLRRRDGLAASCQTTTLYRRLLLSAKTP